MPIPSRSLRWLLTSACLPFMLTTTTLTTTGCPGDGDGDGDGDGGVEVEPGERLTNAISEFYGRCVFSGALYDVIEPGVDTATFGGVNAEAYQQWIEAQLGSDKVVIDEEAAMVCIEHYEGLNASGACYAPDDDEINDACTNAISGTVEDGGECTWSVECQSASCIIDDNGCGTCETFAAEGESCAELDCDYTVDLTCNDNDICVGPLGEGEPCTDEAFNYLGACDGDAGLVCNYETAVCVAGAGVGDSCSDVECAGDLTCNYDLEEPVCEAEPEFEGPADGRFDAGDPCTSEFYDGCSAYSTTLVCIDDDEDGEGVCTPIVAAAEGEACDTIAEGLRSERWCLHAVTTHYCAPDDDGDGIAGTCQPRSTAGESCADAPCDISSACIYDEATAESTCQALPALGEACLEGGRCAAGTTCDEENLEAGPTGTCVEQTSFFDPPMCMADGT